LRVAPARADEDLAEGENRLATKLVGVSGAVGTQLIKAVKQVIRVSLTVEKDHRQPTFNY
jgi:hypothetical protein